jgi:hypothetical protein
VTLYANGIDPDSVPEQFAWEVAGVLEATGRTVRRERYVESMVAESRMRSFEASM